MRLKILRLIIISLFSVIALGLIYTQAIRGNYYYILSKNNRIRVVSVEGRRGRIFDRNGVTIADNRSSFDVALIPQEVEGERKLFRYLGEVLKTDETKLWQLFLKRKSNPFEPVVVASNIKKELAIMLEENKFRFPGLMVRIRTQRYYPFHHVNSHLLGYVGKVDRSKITRLKDYGYALPSTVGKSGVEEYYDFYVRGEDGGLQIEVDHRGRQVRLLSLKEATTGEDLTLTIDNRIQQIATDVLNGQKGAIVVMDLENDEILSMVSSPAYDPNIFIDAPSPRAIVSVLNDPAAPLINRVISGQFPPGSAFKVLVAIGALELNKITPQTSFFCPGFYKLGQKDFLCAHSHGLQDFQRAIARSCNVYFFNAGLLLGPDIINQYAKMFNLGNRTNIDLPFEVHGLIPSSQHRKAVYKRRWYRGDTLNMSIGQGEVLTTPLQLTCMMSMVANNGREIYPHVIKSIGSSEIKQHTMRGKINISEHTFKIVKEGLKKVVTDDEGTGHTLYMDDLNVLGKTGTAQTSGDRPSHAWFVGFCPDAKMKFAFCVFLEHGGSSSNACQIARDLLVRMKEEQIL